MELHPAADAGVEVVEVLADERAAAVFAGGVDAVEGEDEGVAEVVDVVRRASARFRAACGCGAGARLPMVRMTVPLELTRALSGLRCSGAQDAHGVAVAAAGGDDDLGAGVLGELERGEVAGADAAVGVEQRAVHVDGDEARKHPF